MAKAEKFVKASNDAGWDVEQSTDQTLARDYFLVVGNGETYHVATRNNEQVVISHYSGRWNGGYYIIGSHSRKVNNVAGAIHIITIPESAVVEPRAPIGRKGPRGPRQISRRVPFSPADTPDRDVIEALRGHKIRWSNQYTAVEEVGIVPLNGQKTRLDDDDIDEPATRQFTFCDASGEGYRTFALRQLTYVSPGITAASNVPEPPKRGWPKGRKRK